MKAVATTTSTPSFFEFNPKLIPYQYSLIHDIKNRFDYSNGPQYVLLSGSVGSAKSTAMAWLVIKHCTQFDGARALIGRKAMPDLKDTLFQTILEMLANAFVEGVDYVVNLTATSIRFSNGSEMISRSWHDKKYTKFRSLQLSMIAIEELTENNNKEMEFFIECIARMGRLPHVPENLFIAATNPDDPSHKAYEFFIKDAKRTGHYATKDGDKHTYYSVTSSNPFLPKWYIESLKEKYDPKMVRRLLYGEWLYISTDVIYYQYDPEKHFVLNDTKPHKMLPIRISFDFNIQKNKPMSSCLFTFNSKSQNLKPETRRFKFIDEVAVEGARTEDAMDEWQGKGYFDLEHNPEIIVHGDATGRHGDTRNIRNDYDIIENYLKKYIRKDGQHLKYVIEVPLSNPPLRERHNITNGQLENSDGIMAIAIDKRCKTIDKGLVNTRLKEGANYIEDQSTEGQDISTAFAYGVWYCVQYELNKTKAKITFH